MITSVGFLPAAPVLVTDVAAGAAYELDGLRAQCDRVLGDVLTDAVDSVVLIAPDSRSGCVPVDASETRTGWFPADAWGSLRAFGVDVRSGLTVRADDGYDVLEYGHVIGAWMLDRHGYRGTRRALLVAEGDGAPAAALLRDAGDEGDSFALLVMGDGSARLSVKAPGYFDPGAQAFDDAVRHALSSGDPRVLAKLDPGAARVQRASGYDGWQAVASVVINEGRSAWRARCHYEAPYGVGYFAASWI